MGAFDCYWVPGGIRVGELRVIGSGTKKEYSYFNTQPAFEFFDGFKMPELKALLSKAEAEVSDTIWVPNSRGPDWGHIGLKTWYVRALINEYDKEN